MFCRLFSVKASLFVIIIIAFAMAAIACSSSPPAAPAAAPAQPAIDPAELSKLVQDAVKQSVPEQQGGPAPVSAQEIQSMVEAAVSAGAPEGASAEEISAMVQQAVTAAAQPAAQPGASKADIEDIVAKAVGESAQSQSGVSASEVQKIVLDAIKGIPAAAPAPAAPAAPSPGAEMVRDVWGQLVEKPRYGGSIPIATNVAPEIFDPWFGDWASAFTANTSGTTSARWTGQYPVVNVTSPLGIKTWAFTQVIWLQVGTSPQTSSNIRSTYATMLIGTTKLRSMVAFSQHMTSNTAGTASWVSISLLKRGPVRMTGC